METYTGLTDQGFGSDVRLFKATEFERVIAEGRKVASPDLLLWLRKRSTVSSEPPPNAPVRIGISLSRKLGGAVRRNRLKRLVREAFRLNKHSFKSGYDLVVYPRPGCSWRSLDDAKESLLKSCRRAGVLRGVQ